MKSFKLESPNDLKAHLLCTFDLYMPAESSNSDVKWSEIDKDNSIDYDPSLSSTATSCKSFFFPEREDIFKFDGKKFVSTESDGNKQVIFGIHACDLTAIAYQDKFFAEDTYYQARRRNTLLIGIDCLTQCNQGFCHQVDSGPFVRPSTADLILQPLNNDQTSWRLLVVSEYGFKAIQGMKLVSEELGSKKQDGDEFSRQKSQAEVVSHFQHFPYLNDGINKINNRQVSQDQWETLAKQCVTCSGCTQVCPTCSCYTTRDIREAEGPNVTRERIWDSCLYEGFQKEASGHNPTSLPGQRLERFWYHKFSDDFVSKFDRYGCVGCGRCEQVCPGVIGVHSIMKRLSDHE